MPSIPSAVPGGVLFRRREYKATYPKYETVHFEALNIIWGNFKPYGWICDSILIILNPHNLSVVCMLKIIIYRFAKNGKWQWQMANVAMQ